MNEKEQEKGNSRGSGAGSKSKEGRHVHVNLEHMPDSLRELLDEYRKEGGEVHKLPAEVGVMTAGDVVLLDTILTWFCHKGLPRFFEDYFDVESPTERVRATVLLTVKSMQLQQKFDALGKIARHLADEEASKETAEGQEKTTTTDL